MKRWLKLFGLAYVFTVFLWVFNATEGVGANTRSGYVELPNTTGAVPNLYVNGNLQTPLASSQQDVLISFCSSKQEWKLLQEYSNWDNVNRFGYYTDLGVGHNTVLVFRGSDDAGDKDTTYITAGARIGLWLLNDQNGNGIYDGNDSYLFSERMLTRGSVFGEHQWFMVYDVSAFKGTGATYFFDTFNEDFTTSGDFDYLIYIDDDHTDANMDHNDMIVGAISLGNPPVITAPDSTKILCNPDTIRFTVTATDIDAGDSLTLQKTSGPGTFNTVTGTSPLSGQLKYYVSASGTYNFIFKATDKCGKVDYDTATYVITMNTPPTVTAPDSSKFFCGPDTIRFTVTATDPNSGDTLTLSGPGIATPIKGLSPVSANIKIYVSSAGTYNYIYTVTDKCNTSDKDTATYIITMNSPPVVTAPDNNKFICNPGDSVNFSVNATDPNTGQNLTLQKTSGPGSFATVNGVSPLSGTQKWAPITAGTYNFIYKVTDACGAVDYDTATWVITFNTPPVVSAPDSSKFLCNPDTIRFNVSATDTDPNDTLKLELISSPGIFTTVNGPSPLSGTLKYYVTATGTYTFIFKVTDKCGAVDYDTASWFVIKDATTPVVTAPDSSKTLCGPDTIRFTVTATDANPYDTLKLYKYSGPGTFYPDTVKGNPPLSGTLKYYVTASGTYNFIFKTMDKCGRYSFDTATYVINMNTPPVVTAPDSTKFFCGPDTIRFIVTATDPNSGDSLTLSGPGISTPIKGLSPLSANIKIYISSAGTYNYIYTVNDKCGASDADTATWTISMNSAPTVTAPDSSKFFCGPDTIRFTVTATDPNSGDTLTLSGPGIATPIKGLSPLSANIKIYVSSAGTYNYIYNVTDKCGVSDADTASWTITMNSPPVVTAPDNNKFICSPGDSVNFSVSVTDPNTGQNLTLEKTSGPGSFATVNGVSPLSGTQKWAPITAGTYNFIYKVTDACGAVDYDTATWVITFNTPPVVSAPDSSKFLCNPDTIRFNVSATDTDPNDTLKLELTSSPGIFTTVNGPSPVSGTLKYYVTATGTYTFIFKVTDKCGAVDYDTASWFVIKDATTPVVTAPDSSKTLCGPDTIRFTVTATDANPYDTLKLYKYSGPGTFYPDTVKGNPPLSGTLKYYVTASGTYNFIFKTMDKCGRYSFDTATYVINMNTPPVVTAPDSTKFFCGPDTIRFIVTATDPNSGDSLTLSGPGISTPIKGLSPLSANIKIYISSAGTYNYIYTVNDKCGASDADTATWTITMNSPPVVTAPDSSKSFCGPDTIRFTITATDPNSGDSLTLSGPGIPTPIKGLSPLSANIKIYVSSAGTYNYIYNVTDKCGASDVDTATWTITMNHPPTVAAPDSSKFFCGPDTIRFRVTANDPDVGDTITLSGPGISVPIKGVSPLYADVKFYISSGGTYNYVYQVTNHCGSAVYDTATWTITVNSPPVVTAPDSSKFLCGPDTIRFTVTATDPNSGDSLTLSGPGISTPIKGLSPLSANVKIYVSSAGTYNYIYTVSDKCGASDVDTATWTISMNSPPVVIAPDSSKTFCGPDTIRFAVTATDPNSGDTLTLSGPGIPTPVKGLSPLSANVKIYVSSAGTYNYIYSVSDKCGASDVDTATWMITMNHPPTVAAPDSSKFFCGPDTIRFRVTANDPDVGDTITLSGPGIPTPIKGVSPVYADVKFYISTSGTYNYVYQVTNHCGSADYDTATWTITMNSPPVVTAPDSSKFFCGPDTIRFTVTATDPNSGDTLTLSGPGISTPIKGLSPLSANVKIYVSSAGSYNYIYTVSDKCGASDTDTATWIITVNSPPVVTAPDSTKSFCGPDTVRFTVTATDPNSGDTLTLSGPGIPSPIKGLSPLSTNITIYISSAGTYNYIYTVTDKCGASDVDTATWTITMNHPPTVTAPDSSKFFCGPDTIRFRVTATDPDAGDTITLSGPGISVPIIGVSPLYADIKFYISSSGIYNYVYQVTNHCGSAVYDTATWTITINSPPLVIAPDSSKFFCGPDTIKFTVTATDPNTGDTLTLTGPGIPSPIKGLSPLSASIKIYVSSAGTYGYIYTVTDKCGALDADTANWTITINTSPIVNAPDSTKKLCQPDTIRFTVTATDAQTDSITLEGPGITPSKKGVSPLSAQVKFYISSAGTYTYIYKVTDACGAVDYDTAVWIVSINHPPVVIAPDSSKSLCSPDTIRFCVTASDPDVGDTLVLEGPGISTPMTGITSVSACVKFYINSSGTYNYAYKVTNGCGAVDYDTATWAVTINNPPTLNLPQLITACLGDTARLTVTGNDPDNNYNITLEKLSGVGNFITLNGKPPLSGSWTWVPGVSDTLSNPHQVVFKVTDHCGRSVTDTVSVIVQNCACDIFVKIGEDSCANPGDTVSIPVLLKTSVQIGGFDLRIEFDPTVLFFMKVTRGSGLPSGWEYFTYRQLPCPLCGCCKYKLLLLGIYDLKNTQTGAPIEPSSDYIEIARVKFLVSSNNNLRGFFANVCFEWDQGNCTQNSFTDVSGYNLYVSSNPDQFSYADCDTQFHVGNEVLNRVCFEDCGGVQICTTGEKVIGDINLNLIPYDPADLTLFSNYFIYGLSVFMSDPNWRSVQIANTDVNRDGFTLTLSDFIYMIRVILHDASPLPKLTPEESQLKVLVTTRNSDHIITFDSKVPVGAALLVFKHKNEIASPELSSSQMEMRAGDVNGEFRVLIYSSAGNSISSGINEVLKIKAKEGLELVSIEAVDPYGRPLSVTKASSALPKEFTLYPNYPNPFNPETNISFALPENSKVCLKIYNLSGQLVKTLVDANLSAGTYTVSWNGTNSSESKVASGIYFYKLSAGNYSQTRKMCLIK